MMEDSDKSSSGRSEDGGGDSSKAQYWWATASSAQLGLAIFSLKRGYAGDGSGMPFKAFAVASLFVGAGASFALSLLNASGVHKVQDFLDVGASIRTSLGVRPRGTP